MEEKPLSHPDAHDDLSPEGRRREAQRRRAGFRESIDRHFHPGSRLVCVLQRVWNGAYYDGSIHAGNLAYMAIISLFPFFVVVAGVFSLLGSSAESEASIYAFLSAAPPVVRHVLEPVARDVLHARSGWLLWGGALVGLWTVSSLVETIRDILHRAYGTKATQAFWRYRLLSTGFIVASVVALLVSLFAQVAISAAQEVISAWFPHLEGWVVALATSRIIPAVVLFLSVFALFLSLTPSAYRGSDYPKWPGALLVTVWWVAVLTFLPSVLRLFFNYDLTYGSLAGVMIALFFFWLVGLGMVVGAELNAALAETPEERDMLGQADNRERRHRARIRDDNE
jgi:membrane protein